MRVARVFMSQLYQHACLQSIISLDNVLGLAVQSIKFVVTLAQSPFFYTVSEDLNKLIKENQSKNHYSMVTII